MSGEDEDLTKLGFVDSDEEVDLTNFKKLEDQEEETDEPVKQSIFSRLTGAFQDYTGNRTMTRADLAPILERFTDQLTDRNVSVEVAQQICKQVENSLVDRKTASFTSVQATIQTALVDAISKLLTPNRHIDILKEALAAKKRG